MIAIDAAVSSPPSSRRRLWSGGHPNKDVRRSMHLEHVRFLADIEGDEELAVTVAAKEDQLLVGQVQDGGSLPCAATHGGAESDQLTMQLKNRAAKVGKSAGSGRKAGPI
jgi:hypothetical protein